MTKAPSMPKLTAIAALLSTLAFSPSVQAMDGNTAIDFCDPGPYQSDVACSAFLLGALSGAGWGNSMIKDLETGDITSCVPRGISIEASEVVVIDYIRKHPENRTILAAILAHVALAEAFPCE